MSHGDDPLLFLAPSLHGWVGRPGIPTNVTEVTLDGMRDIASAQQRRRFPAETWGPDTPPPHEQRAQTEPRGSLGSVAAVLSPFELRTFRLD